MAVTLVCPTIVPVCGATHLLGCPSTSTCPPTQLLGCPSTSTCPPTQLLGCPSTSTCPPTHYSCPAPTHLFICPPITHQPVCQSVTATCPIPSRVVCPTTYTQVGCHPPIDPTTTVVQTTVVGTTVAGTTLHQQAVAYDPPSITCMTMYCNQAPAQQTTMAAQGQHGAATAATVCTQYPPCPPQTQAFGCPRTSTCPPTYAPGCPSTSTCPPAQVGVVGPTGVLGCTQSPAQCGHTTWQGCPPQTSALGCPSTSTCPPTHLLGCTCLPWTVGPVMPTQVC
jgi:hypothetical protein